MANGGIYAFHLVRGDARADPRAADQYPPLSFPVLDGTSHLFGKIGEVHRVRGIRTQVDGFVPGIPDSIKSNLFEWEAGVVKADGYFHITPIPSLRATEGSEAISNILTGIASSTNASSQ